MMVSLVCAQTSAFGASETRLAPAASGNDHVNKIALSDGALAAATRISGDFGYHRFTDRLKMTAVTP